MADDGRMWFVKGTDGSVYGPARADQLVLWAREGRVGPGWSVSNDRVAWMPPQSIPQMGMDWLVESEPGRVYGPFHRDYLLLLQQRGALPEGTRFYRFHATPLNDDSETVFVEKVVEKVVVQEVVKEVVKEVRVEVPVERPSASAALPVATDPSRAYAVAKVEPRGRWSFWNLFRGRKSNVFRNVSDEHMQAIEQAAMYELQELKRRGADGLFGAKK